MASALAKIYIVLSGAILVVAGVVGFFRHEMFNLTFPLAHNIFHFASGVIALWAGLGKSADGAAFWSDFWRDLYVGGHRRLRRFARFRSHPTGLEHAFQFHPPRSWPAQPGGRLGQLKTGRVPLSGTPSAENHVVKRSGEMGRNCQAASEVSASRSLSLTRMRRGPSGLR